jgi:hypothetical protein
VPLEYILSRPLELGPVEHVRRERERIWARSRHRGGDAVGVPGEDADGRACRRQRVREREAERATAAGNNCDAPGEVELRKRHRPTLSPGPVLHLWCRSPLFP